MLGALSLLQNHKVLLDVAHHGELSFQVFPTMPASPQVNVSRVYVDQWQPPSASQASESTLQSLLFNILTVALAAATLVVACLHFMHQRKSKRDRDVFHGTRGHSL